MERLQRIQELTELGLNLAGVERVLALEEQMDAMADADASACRRELAEARRRRCAARCERSSARTASTWCR